MAAESFQHDEDDTYMVGTVELLGLVLLWVHQAILSYKVTAPAVIHSNKNTESPGELINCREFTNIEHE